MALAFSASQPSQPEGASLFDVSERRGDSTKRPEASSHIMLPVKKSHKRTAMALVKNEDKVRQSTNAHFEAGANLFAILAPLALPNAEMLIPKVKTRRDQPSRSVLISMRNSAGNNHPLLGDEGLDRMRLLQATIFQGSPFKTQAPLRQTGVQNRHAAEPSVPFHNARLRRDRDQDGPSISG